MTHLCKSRRAICALPYRNSAVYTSAIASLPRRNSALIKFQRVSTSRGSARRSVSWTIYRRVRRFADSAVKRARTEVEGCGARESRGRAWMREKPWRKDGERDRGIPMTKQDESPYKGTAQKGGESGEAGGGVEGRNLLQDAAHRIAPR